MRTPKVATPQAVLAATIDRATVVDAFRTGLRVDGASEAAGAAFLAVSWTNGGDIDRARACAIEARRLNPTAWAQLSAVFGGGHG